ncbi:MAG: hypothetical protein NVS1B2_11920 [Vulcanimicrobiaceae bacterium]
MRAASTIELRLWIVAVVCFALFAALGAFVSSRPPTKIDLAGAALRGEFTSAAVFFTALGRTYPLIAITVFAGIVALAARASVVPVIVLIVSQVTSQGVVSLIKPLYHRARPDHFLLYREKDLSFPSGHATTSIVFFAALALLALRSPLPRPVAIGAASLAAACVVGIPWSRLALGAHYVTDVTGGLLFGTGWLCVVAAVAMRLGAIR